MLPPSSDTHPGACTPFYCSELPTQTRPFTGLDDKGRKKKFEISCCVCGNLLKEDLDFLNYWEPPDVDVLAETYVVKHGIVINPTTVYQVESHKYAHVKCPDKLKGKIKTTKLGKSDAEKTKPSEFDWQSDLDEKDGADNNSEPTAALGGGPKARMQGETFCNRNTVWKSFSKGLTPENAIRLKNVYMGLQDMHSFEYGFYGTAPAGKVTRSRVDSTDSQASPTKQTIMIIQIGSLHGKKLKHGTETSGMPLFQNYVVKDKAVEEANATLRKYALDAIFPDVNWKRTSLSDPWKRADGQLLITHPTAAIPSVVPCRLSAMMARFITDPGRGDDHLCRAWCCPRNFMQAVNSDDQKGTDEDPASKEQEDTPSKGPPPPETAGLGGPAAGSAEKTDENPVAEDAATQIYQGHVPPLLELNLRDDETKIKMELMREDKSRDVDGVVFDESDMFRAQLESNGKYFQSDVEWWSGTMTFGIYVTSKGKTLEVGLVEFAIQNQLVHSDEKTTPKRNKKQRVQAHLYLENVFVKSDKISQSLGKYAVWFGIQLSRYINKYTLAHKNEYNKSQVGPIKRMVLRTGSAVTHMSMHKAALSNDMEFKDLKDTESFWNCEFSIAIDEDPSRGGDEKKMWQNNLTRPQIITGTPFAETIPHEARKAAVAPHVKAVLEHVGKPPDFKDQRAATRAAFDHGVDVHNAARALEPDFVAQARMPASLRDAHCAYMFALRPLAAADNAGLAAAYRAAREAEIQLDPAAYGAEHQAVSAVVAHNQGVMRRNKLRFDHDDLAGLEPRLPYLPHLAPEALRAYNDYALRNPKLGLAAARETHLYTDGTLVAFHEAAAKADGEGATTRRQARPQPSARSAPPQARGPLRSILKPT